MTQTNLIELLNSQTLTADQIDAIVAIVEPKEVKMIKLEITIDTDKRKEALSELNAMIENNSDQTTAAKESKKENKKDRELRRYYALVQKESHTEFELSKMLKLAEKYSLGI